MKLWKLLSVAAVLVMVVLGKGSPAQPFLSHAFVDTDAPIVDPAESFDFERR
jgi:hypothetical protein